MRTRIWLVIYILILVFSLSGCKGEMEAGLAAVDKQETKTIIVEAIEIDPRTNEYPTKLSEFSFDFDLDNVEETIELHTAAGHGPDGKMMYDDGQKWLLVVIDNNRYYPLFSNFVQLGEVYFSLSKVGEQMMPQVNVLLSTHGGMEIIDFVFNKDQEHYEGTVVYRPIDKVQCYTSIPSY